MKVNIFVSTQNKLLNISRYWILKLQITRLFQIPSSNFNQFGIFNYHSIWKGFGDLCSNDSSHERGPGKSMYPLSANTNVLSTTFHFRFRFPPQCYINVPSAFCPNVTLLWELH